MENFEISSTPTCTSDGRPLPYDGDLMAAQQANDRAAIKIIMASRAEREGKRMSNFDAPRDSCIARVRSALEALGFDLGLIDNELAKIPVISSVTEETGAEIVSVLLAGCELPPRPRPSVAAKEPARCSLSLDDGITVEMMRELGTEGSFHLFQVALRSVGPSLVSVFYALRDIERAHDTRRISDEERDWLRQCLLVHGGLDGVQFVLLSRGMSMRVLSQPTSATPSASISVVKEIDSPPPPLKLQRIDSLEEVYTCPLTLEVFSSPISLACGHTFELAEIKKAISAKKSCPTCRADVKVPSGGFTHANVNIALRETARRFFPEAVIASQRTELEQARAEGIGQIDVVLRIGGEAGALFGEALNALAHWASINAHHDILTKKALGLFVRGIGVDRKIELFDPRTLVALEALATLAAGPSSSTVVPALIAAK